MTDRYDKETENCTFRPQITPFKSARKDQKY